MCWYAKCYIFDISFDSTAARCLGVSVARLHLIVENASKLQLFGQKLTM